MLLALFFPSSLLLLLYQIPTPFNTHHTVLLVRLSSFPRTPIPTCRPAAAAGCSTAIVLQCAR
jgi:hypothetical protein